MSGDLFYRDVAVLAGERTDDAWEAIADSYEFVTMVAVALLQKLGRQRLPKDWETLARGFVVIATPLKDGTYRLEAVRRGEVRSDSLEGAERLREKWERQYRRRDEG